MGAVWAAVLCLPQVEISAPKAVTYGQAVGDYLALVTAIPPGEAAQSVLAVGTMISGLCLVMVSELRRIAGIWEGRQGR